MLEKIGGLVRNLVALIFVATLLEMLIPRGSFSRYLRLVIGLLVILMIINFIGAPAGSLTGVYPSSPAEGFAGGEEVAEEIRGRQLYELNRKEALNEYRSMITAVIEDEILRWQKWIPVSVSLLIEEDENNPLFGSIYQAVVRIRAAVGISAPAENFVRIDPVRITISPTEGRGGETGDKRVPELESVLADQLQLPKNLIEVWEIKTADIDSEITGFEGLEIGGVRAVGGIES